MSLRTVTRMTFHEAVQRRLVAAVSLMGVLFLALFTIGFYFAHRNAKFTVVGERPEVINFFLLTGLYVVNFLLVVLTILASCDTVAGEISSGTIQTLVTKPLRRWKVILGKWLGMAAMLCAFGGILSGAMMGVIFLLTGYLPPNPIQGIALMLLESLVLLSLSLLGGARFSTLTNGIVLLMLYGLAFIAGWIEQIGAFLRSQTMSSLGIAISLIIPSEALWRRAAYLMQPPFLRQLGFGPFATATAPSTVMVLWAVLYGGAALVLAVRIFNRRDL